MYSIKFIAFFLHSRLYSFLKVLIAVSLSAILSTPMFIFSHVINMHMTPPTTNSSIDNTTSGVAFARDPSSFSPGVESELVVDDESPFSEIDLHSGITQFASLSSNFLVNASSFHAVYATILTPNTSGFNHGDAFNASSYDWPYSVSEVSPHYDVMDDDVILTEDGSTTNARCYLQAAENQRKAYFLIQYFAIFVFPGVLMAWLYCEMLREFKKVTAFFEKSKTSSVSLLNQPRTSSDSRQCVNDRMSELNLIRKKKVTRLILIIILLFMICYIPFSSMVLFQSFYKFVPWNQKWYKLLHFVFVTLTYVNSCANPFLYTLLCKRQACGCKKIK